MARRTHLMLLSSGGLRSLVATGLTACTFVVLAGYDALALRYIDESLSRKRIAFSAFVGYAVSQAIGNPILTGGSVRYRLYSLWGLSPRAVAKAILFAGVSFWLGFCTLGGVVFSVAPLGLAEAFGLTVELLPMSDDPVATVVHTEEGPMHFQEFWVAHGGGPAVESVEFRGSESASPTDDVRRALSDPVVVGPSNPVTSIGPMLALEGVPELLAETTVVAVSPFVEDRVFSGPADDLLAATGREPSTAGVAAAYPFADAFVVDGADGTDLD
ncbi:hypothetical protein BRC64_03695, partial [Halobacteriales archaeon QH_10_67_22]